MRFYLPFLLLFLLSCAAPTADLRNQTAELSPEARFELFLLEQNRHFAAADESPLTEADHARFMALNYFEYNPMYRVEAEWVSTPGLRPFEMPTSTERMARFLKQGEYRFTIGGDSLVLSAYKSLDRPMGMTEESTLFLPFNDLTNGITTYGGGRYMDVEPPAEDGMVTLDLNLTYHPYCAYNYKYSCPIPPEENMLDVAIEAGVMMGINGERWSPEDH
jgi:hypothetical protein